MQRAIFSADSRAFAWSSLDMDGGLTLSMIFRQAFCASSIVAFGMRAVPGPPICIDMPLPLNCGSGMSTPCLRMHWAYLSAASRSSCRLSPAVAVPPPPQAAKNSEAALRGSARSVKRLVSIPPSDDGGLKGG